jgi:transposase-like protein
MSIEMDEEIKRWPARRKSALVLEIVQGKTTVSESSRQFDLFAFGDRVLDRSGQGRNGERAEGQAGGHPRAV